MKREKNETERLAVRLGEVLASTLNSGINLESDATIERADNSEGQGPLAQCGM